VAACAVTRTTRAILIERHGAPDVLAERDVPLAPLAPDAIHLRVRAAGVNFADLWMRVGLYGTVPDLPYSPGFEVAGEVVAAGERVAGWRAGDPAVALMRYGGYARDVVIPSRNVFRFPDSLGFAEAAAMPVAFLTAWVALFEAARVRAGETALVLVAAGGVGSAAVQLARRHGLRVVGTAGTEEKRAFVVRELGAEACFDSRGAWEQEVQGLLGDRGVDVALDALGGRATAACRRLLAPLGRLVFYGMSAGLPKPKRSWIRAAQAYLGTPKIHPLSLVEPNVGIFGIHLLHLGKREDVLRPALEEIFRATAAGELRPVVDRAFPLTAEGAAAAHRYVHSRQSRGKVVLQADS